MAFDWGLERMATIDDLGHTLTGATASSKAHYDKALHQLQCFIGDPVGSIDEALVLSPNSRHFLAESFFAGSLFIGW